METITIIHPVGSHRFLWWDRLRSVVVTHVTCYCDANGWKIMYTIEPTDGGKSLYPLGPCDADHLSMTAIGAWMRQCEWLYEQHKLGTI